MVSRTGKSWFHGVKFRTSPDQMIQTPESMVSIVYRANTVVVVDVNVDFP